MDKTTYLKVKVKSLAAEAGIIHIEERKHKNQDDLRNGLTNHRKIEVRDEQRATLIAYGFMRGKAYREIEPNAKKPVNWTRVGTMLYKYCPFSQRAAIDLWIKESK